MQQSDLGAFFFSLEATRIILQIKKDITLHNVDNLTHLVLFFDS